MLFFAAITLVFFGEVKGHDFINYVLSAFFWTPTMGLMRKPMLVTLPFVLLLLEC